MNQQRKKPALRLFHGAAGSPLSQTNDVATAAPLSNAERQKAFRQRRRETKEAPERAALTAAVLRKYRTLDGIGERSSRERTKEMRENHQRETEELTARLAEMSLSELRLFAAEHGEEYKAAPDDKGRYLTDLETNPADKGSHDHKVLTGQYKIAEIVAVREHQEATLGSPREYGNGQELLGGRREVRPQGTSPDTDGEGKLNKNSRSAKFDRKKFKVKLGAHQYDLTVRDLAATHFETVAATKTVVDDMGDMVTEGHDEFFRCKLCRVSVWWEKDKLGHIEDVHGDPDSPEHNRKHGDIIAAYLRAERKKGNKMLKAGKTVLSLFQEHEQIRLRRQAKLENWGVKPVTG